MMVMKDIPDKHIRFSGGEQMKVYIAGPMTGYKNFNRETFILMAGELERRKSQPLHTAYMPVGLPYEEYMEKSFELIDRADAVYLLPKWYASKGAVREVYFAHTKGIPITESLSMLEQFRSEVKND